jgi:dTDP-4-amino-4,6-dideoxygalactose transaminase
MLNHSTFAPWPSYSFEEASAVQKVLLSNKVNYWTGNEARLFEKDFADWTGVSYAIALANGTLAIDIALHALCIGAGDEVIVTPRTFIASVSCIVNAGAIPIFADVDSHSGNISADTIAKVITPKTKAIICVHLAGWPCDMDPIMDLAIQHDLKVIEDCAQAHGALYKGRSVGTIGHVGAWSFCQDKIMTTGGEGGMVTTNDEYLWRKMWAYKDHGKSYEAVYERDHPEGFRWVHESFGTNGRMLEFQAAIGRIQLKLMSKWIQKRNRNAQLIMNAFEKFEAVRVPHFKCSQACDNKCAIKRNCKHAYYKAYVYVKPEKLKIGWSRDRIINDFNQMDIPCFQGGCSEVYLEKAFDDKNFKPESRLPTAKSLGENSLMLLVHPTLTDENLKSTIDAIKQILLSASS